MSLTNEKIAEYLELCGELDQAKNQLCASPDKDLYFERVRILNGCQNRFDEIADTALPEALKELQKARGEIDQVVDGYNTACRTSENELADLKGKVEEFRVWVSNIFQAENFYDTDRMDIVNKFNETLPYPK